MRSGTINWNKARGYALNVFHNSIWALWVLDNILINQRTGGFHEFDEWCLQVISRFLCDYIYNNNLIYSNVKDQYAKHLHIVLDILGKQQSYVKLSKCNFFLFSIAFLVHIVSQKRVMDNPQKYDKASLFRVTLILWFVLWLWIVLLYFPIFS